MRSEAWRRRVAWRWSGGGVQGRLLIALFHTLFLLALPTSANLPLFDVTAKMRILLIPSDVPVGTVIYRLRATDSDFDYPLHFDTNGGVGRSVVIIRDLPCSRNKTHCSANVHLKRQLKDGAEFKFRISVTDSSGDSTVVDCTLKGTTPTATAARTAAFPRYPGVIFAKEDTKIGSVLDYIIARKNSENARHVHLEIWGSDLFSVKHSLASQENVNVTIVLAKPLDFENQAVHRILVLATDPYVDSGIDTRNVAELRLEIAVLDVQDTPPRFILAPPATRLNSSLVPGNVVLQVKAEDGDRGIPRSLRYGLLSSGNPFTPFFRMDETTGELKLARPLKQLAAITQSNAPLVVLQVLASEMVLPPDDDPLNSESTVEVALILETLARGPPRFESNQYVARIAEGSAQGTALQFTSPWVPTVKDDDMGRSGFFALSLENDNGTFEISPNIAERSATFVIQVKNNRMLDYEKFRELNFKVVATEVGSGGGEGGASSTASATIYIDDVNDNPPVFLKEEYFAELQENATAGTKVVQVQATDVDTGIFGRVSYTRLLGRANASLALDAVTGVITVAMNDHTFDREAAPEHRLHVEARDKDGTGLRATVPLVIRLLDINDEVPIFSRAAYEFFLDRDGKNFTSEARVEATDKDSEPPNNIVRYEIVSGNYENKFHIDEITGRITLREPLTKDKVLVKKLRRLKRKVRASDDDEDEEEKVIMLNVRAYDLGVPHRWSQAVVRVYPRGATPGTRYVLFVVPKPPTLVETEWSKTEKLLSELTGGKVTLVEVKLHHDHDKADGVDRNKSDVLTRVIYPANAVIDVDHLSHYFVTVNTTTPQRDVSTTVVTQYRSEVGAAFWVLLTIALFFVILVLILLCCCSCACCPLYGAYRKRLRIESQESLRPIVHQTVVGTNAEDLAEGETKAEEPETEAKGPREAWSSDQKVHHSHKMHNGHRGHRRGSVDAGSEDAESLLERGQHYSPQHGGRRHGPNLIYSRKTQQKWTDEYPVYLEDVEDSPGRRRRRDGHAGGGRRRHQSQYMSQRDSHHQHGHRRYADDMEEDNDSLRRHELERGSDHGAAARQYYAGGGGHYGHYRLPARAQDAHHLRREALLRDKLAEEEEGVEEVEEREGRYVREGDAEILRLVTRGGGGDEEGDVTGAGRGGKEILLRRFMADQEGEGDKEKEEAAAPAAQPEPPPPPPQPPPPVPSQAACTQTDVHAETQTDPFVPESEEEEISVASSKGSKKKKHCHKRSRSRHRSKKCKASTGMEVKSPIQEEKDGVENGSQKSDPPLYVDNKSSILRKNIFRSTDAEPSDAEPPPRVRKTSENGGVRKSFSEPYRTGSVNNSYRLNTGCSVSDGEGEERKMSRNRRGSLPDISSRYMDWYKDLMESGGPKAKAEKKAAEKKAAEMSLAMKIARRRKEWLQERSESVVHRVTLNVPAMEDSKAGSQGNSARATEDDMDSGIALNSHTLGIPAASEQQQKLHSPGGGAFGGIVGGGKKLLEKKSVFAIAYDDMHTKQLRADSISPPY